MKTPHLWLDRRIAAAGPYLALCLNEAEFARAWAECHTTEARPTAYVGPRAHASTWWLHNKNGSLVAIVCLGDVTGRNSVEIAGLLVHEAVHVWQRYAENIGETRPGDEQEAYAVQAIAQELMAAYAARALKEHLR